MTRIYEARHHLLIHAEYKNPAEHRHKAAHIIISTQEAMTVKSNRTTYLCKGMVIPSGVLHTVDTHGNAALIFLYDCTTNVAKYIQKIQCISDAACNMIIASYFTFLQDGTAETYHKLENCVLMQLGFPQTSCSITDTRISDAMKYIHCKITENITCQEVAKSVYLSQSRFSHLFNSQTGMTFASYVIYQRLMYVYSKILEGKTITDAALEAGFSSSTHFAEVNRRIFGISASHIVRKFTFTKIQ